MPKENDRWLAKNETLTDAEIVRLVKIFGELGIEKVRITGGEPLLRPNIEELIKQFSVIRGIRSVSLTTNGQLLGDKVFRLKRAGLKSVNISLDSLRRERFKSMTGADCLDKVLCSINAAQNAGLQVKINSVIVRGWNDDEVIDLTRFAIATGHPVRFIEFMPLDGSDIWAPDMVFSKREMMKRIQDALGPMSPISNASSEPAQLYSVADKGIVGFIPSMTEPFCRACDRVRITSDGRFLTCLFENPGHDIKSLLRASKSDKDIAQFVVDSMKRKPEGVAALIKAKSLRPKMNLMHTIGG
jgi:cyclic pyranopterin phosphate synthase